MHYYIKELPDNTLTLITHTGEIIGKFDDTDDIQGICIRTDELDRLQSRGVELSLTDVF